MENSILNLLSNQQEQIQPKFGNANFLNNTTGMPSNTTLPSGNTLPSSGISIGQSKNNGFDLLGKMAGMAMSLFGGKSPFAVGSDFAKQMGNNSANSTTSSSGILGKLF